MLHTMTINGFRFQMEQWGDSGEPFILLHGLASTRHMFDLVAPLLADTFTVYAPDQRGHGESGKPETGYDFGTICADLDAWVDALAVSRPFRLAGHSWGAYTALHYAATRPERVSRLFLIDGGVAAIRDRFGVTWPEAEARMAPHSFAGVTRAALETMIQERWLGDAYRPELLPLALSIFDTSDPDQVRAWLPRDQHLQIAHALWAYDPLAGFARLSAPTTAIVALQGDAPEPVIADAVEAALAACPALDVCWMEHTIHDIPWQRPAELAAILRAGAGDAPPVHPHGG